ncbi:MAG: tRNA epoxyqueuosine(34) reductase QueG [Chitinophagales bacterium]
MLHKNEYTEIIKNKSTEAGFSFCGISKAEQLTEEAKQLENWLHQGKHGKMHYMENYFEKRIDPSKLVPGSKSVISLMYNYFTDQKQNDISAPRLSQYAFGEDYHQVIKTKLRFLLSELQKEIGDFHARVFVDSAPVMEKAWAKKSGIGWQGKNTNIINPKAGSYFFLAEIICDLELNYDSPLKDYCGSCTACIDACPTDALHNAYTIDAGKCISYLTIELRDEILPTEFKNKMDGWMFGCDVCQDVCPWNRFSNHHKEDRFLPADGLLEMRKEDWVEITEEVYKNLFKNSAVERTKFAGLKRNILFLQKK